MHARTDEIVAIANELIGMKYRHQGRGNGSIDCVGVPIYIAKKLGLSDWDTVNYGPRPALRVFNELIIKTGLIRISMTELSRGDVVQISWEGTPPVHVGIIEVDARGQMWLIHAFMIHRKVSRDPVTPEIHKSFVAAWRFPE